MTTMTRFTKEQLIEHAQKHIAHDAWLKENFSDAHKTPATVELARIALAALTADPVRYLNKFSGTCVTLEQQPNAADDVAVYIPLYAAPPASDRERIRREHAEWSDKTFGDVGPVGPLKHLSKEAIEAAADPSDPLEWADMQFLLWDAQRRMGISDEFITRAMIEKLAINKARQWPEPKDGEPRLHIKEQPVPAASSESVSQSLTDALRDVIAERQRQVSVKGWTPEHDDTYTCGELSGAAISYIEPMEAVFYWPAEWHDDSFKPSDERRNLVKATALLLAEIERLDRISAASALSEVSDGKARED
ncbi:DUF550 domain-containing protein [Salmonella enterica]|nr:DUF550 domain-containing protein [Salmonella enterica]